MGERLLHEAVEDTILSDGKRVGTVEFYLAAIGASGQKFADVLHHRRWQWDGVIVLLMVDGDRQRRFGLHLLDDVFRVVSAQGLELIDGRRRAADAGLDGLLLRGARNVDQKRADPGGEEDDNGKQDLRGNAEGSHKNRRAWRAIMAPVDGPALAAATGVIGCGAFAGRQRPLPWKRCASWHRRP